MNFVKNLRIGVRINGLVALLLLLMLVAGTTGLLALRQVTTRSTDFIRLDFTAGDALSDVRASMIQLRRHEKDIFINLGKPDVVQKYAQSWDETRGEVDRALDRLDGVAGAVGIAESVATMRKSLAAYDAVFARVRKGLATFESTQAANAAMGEAKTAFHDAESTARKINDTLDRRADDNAKALSATVQASTGWIVGACLLGLVAGAVSGILVTRSIAGPIATAVRIANTVASGDLTSRIVVDRRDETGQLLQALRQMNESVARIVGTVRQSSESIASGSSQIATGGADLSQRTEEQASSLQQAAASMEQLNATVRNSADAARDATRLASAASGVAEQGGAMVGRVVETMEAISASSRRIGDITGVIDGIAFQTNILALNAAVEAARAGEQGRGFAVVAGEVRTLAQRSAEAAKEIKGLIGASVETVDAGSRLVKDAGQTMDEIVSQVRKVAQLIGDIGAATMEQTRGIEQVSEAVTQLDKVTQQNASLVEESSAAADSLNQQSVRLVDAVSVFRLETREGALA